MWSVVDAESCMRRAGPSAGGLGIRRLVPPLVCANRGRSAHRSRRFGNSWGRTRDGEREGARRSPN
jgi:hypothetical protein